MTNTKKTIEKNFAKCSTNPYFILVNEWNYPTESGAEPIDCTFYAHDAAIDYAKELCLKEMDNFMKVTGCDPTMPSTYHYSKIVNGEVVDIICKNGLDDWYFAVRLIELTPIA